MQVRTEGGMVLHVHFGYTVNKMVFEAVTDLIYAQVMLYANNHDQMTRNLDFYADNPVARTHWEYFAYLPPRAIQRVSSTVLQLAFSALYTVLAQDPDTGTVRTAPYLATSWTLLSPDRSTPILAGFFRQRFKPPP